MKHIVITGVSSGIGRSLATDFLEKGWTVFGTIRNAGDASELQSRYKQTFIPFVLDITDYPAVREMGDEIDRILGQKTLDALVNNAGIAVYGPLVHVPVSRIEHQLKVNISAQIQMVQVFAPLLGMDEKRSGSPGTIVQLGSVSGRFAFPFLGPYCASKYAIEAVCDCLRRELRPFGIHVALLQPSAVQSRVWEKSRSAEFYVRGTPYEVMEKMQKRFIDSTAKRALPASVITKVVWKIVNGRRRKARYLIAPNRITTRIFWQLPDRMVDWLVMKRLKKLGMSYRTTS